MKLLLIRLVLLLTHFIYSETGKFDHVRKYLAEHKDITQSEFSRGDTPWLKNSNTIAFGYNPLYGSPICYTGTCQAEGFRNSVFQVNYVQPMLGSCTSKLIPDFVQLHCIPSSDLQASTETISTVKQLSDSTSKAISFGSGIKYNLFSAGYSYSTNTRFMVDEMIKQDTTATFTRGQVTFAKLSMFEPMMKLSDPFRYAIEEMPCCEYNEELQQYVEEYFIGYFGLTFVTELVLGGIAQEINFIENKEIKKMESNGQDVSHSANIGFFVTFNMNTASSYNKTQQDEFKRSIKSTRATKLGGDPSVSTMDAWIRSVPENPVIISYAVKDILTLLTTRRFPNDSQIQNKSKLVDMAVQTYLNKQKPTCLNDCTDKNHGECDITTTTQFLFGTCKCLQGWKGNDCSQKVVCPLAFQPSQNQACIRPQWSKKPIVVSGGNGHGSALNQLGSPSDISLDSNGTVYVAEYGNDRITRWKRDLNQIGEIVVDNLPQFVFQVSVTDDGTVFALAGQRIFKFPKNSRSYTLISKALKVDPTSSLIVDVNQNVYVAETHSHRVLKWTPNMPPQSDGIVVAGTGKIGSAVNELEYPTTLFLDECQNLYVYDFGNKRIQYWPNGAMWGTSVITYNDERFINDLKVDRSGNIYTIETFHSGQRDTSRLMKYSADDEEIVNSDNGAGTVMNLPTTMEFDKSGNMYICDQNNHRILMFPLQSGTFGC